MEILGPAPHKPKHPVLKTSISRSSPIDLISFSNSSINSPEFPIVQPVPAQTKTCVLLYGIFYPPILNIVRLYILQSLLHVSNDVKQCPLLF